MRALLPLLLIARMPAIATDVVTHHNNPQRTGAVLDETTLTPQSIKTQKFGRLFSLLVDGQVYAQPLVVSGLDMPGKGPRNVVFLATMRNMVYAYDGDRANEPFFWSKSLGGPMPFDRIPKDAGAQLGQYSSRPDIGIASTPVIDRTRGRMYVIAKVAEPPCPGVDDTTDACPVEYRLHAIRLTDGEILQRVSIEIPLPGVPAK